MNTPITLETATYLEVKALLPFESVSCTRCGGSGSYSYCSSYGTRCFKCGGSGKVYTKRAKVALEYLRSLRIKPTNASEVKVGDKVWQESYMFGGKAGWCKVLSTKVRESDPRDLEIELERKSGLYKAIALFTSKDSILELQSGFDDKASWVEAVKFQNSLSRMGKPTKATSAPASEWYSSLSKPVKQL